ncbi:hypothetical protein [Nocardia terpenica]|uniref:Uncharacterized protein n=1 Tax=Nocardia terpenica TaxID=455432 RepID=A0A164H2R7_9NOCA|nr:hypothetical protein [Nocardia terpenica]KZM68149.1 hypothetical protein AWN90_09415 [Nocardia terpenica]NQE88991.1 hypothetical protein [Nocardia terpenica]
MDRKETPDQLLNILRDVTRTCIRATTDEDEEIYVASKIPDLLYTMWKAFHELDKALTVGEPLPAAWQRAGRIPQAR